MGLEISNVCRINLTANGRRQHWLLVGAEKGNTECKSYPQPFGSTRVKSAMSRLGELWPWLWLEDESGK